MSHADLASGSVALVILVTGGARGMSGRIAVTLAERYRCRLEIIGDSILPDPEDEVLAACADAATIRRLLVDRGLRSPYSIEAETGRILAAREILSALAACERAGARVTYHVCTTDEPQEFAALVDDIYESAGRIDGVVHDAGRTTLADKLRSDVRFVVFLASATREALPELARCMLGPIVSIIAPERGMVNALDELGSGDAAQVLYLPDAGETAFWRELA